MAPLSSSPEMCRQISQTELMFMVRLAQEINRLAQELIQAQTLLAKAERALEALNCKGNAEGIAQILAIDMEKKKLEQERQELDMERKKWEQERQEQEKEYERRLQGQKEREKREQKEREKRQEELERAISQAIANLENLQEKKG
jgi:hypothetical protein